MGRPQHLQPRPTLPPAAERQTFLLRWQLDAPTSITAPMATVRTPEPALEDPRPERGPASWGPRGVLRTQWDAPTLNSAQHQGQHSLGPLGSWRGSRIWGIPRAQEGMNGLCSPGTPPADLTQGACRRMSPVCPVRGSAKQSPTKEPLACLALECQPAAGVGDRPLQCPPPCGLGPSHTALPEHQSSSRPCRPSLTGPCGSGTAFPDPPRKMPGCNLHVHGSPRHQAPCF